MIKKHIASIYILLAFIIILLYNIIIKLIKGGDILMIIIKTSTKFIKCGGSNAIIIPAKIVKEMQGNKLIMEYENGVIKICNVKE